MGPEYVVHTEGHAEIPTGIGHAARDGEATTLCGRTTSGLRVFDEHPFSTSGTPAPACEDCLTVFAGLLEPSRDLV
jgi:hypothetical protein